MSTQLPTYARIINIESDYHDPLYLDGQQTPAINGLLVNAPFRFDVLDLRHYEVPLIVRAPYFTGRKLCISHFAVDGWHQCADHFCVQELEISVPLDLLDDYKKHIDDIKHPDAVQFIPLGSDGKPDEAGTIAHGYIGKVTIKAQTNRQTKQRGCQGIASFNGTLQDIHIGGNGIHIETDMDQHGISAVHLVDCVIGSHHAPCKIFSPSGTHQPGVVIADRKQSRVSTGNQLINIDAPFFDIPDAAACQAVGCTGYSHSEPQETAMSNQSTQQMSSAGVRQLIASESPEPHPYHCSAGYPTIGVGHKMSRSEAMSGKIQLPDGRVLDYRKKGGLTQFEIIDLLKADLPEFNNAVNDAIHAPLRQNEVDALVHFAFNVGAPAFRSSTLVKRINEQRYDDVPNQIRRWKYETVNGKKRESRGLMNRREVEVAMWEGKETHGEVDVSWLPDASPIENRHIAEPHVQGDPQTPASPQPDAQGFDETYKRVTEQLKAETEERIRQARAEAVDAFIIQNSKPAKQSKILATSAVGITGTVAALAGSYFGLSTEVVALLTGGLGVLTNAANWYWRRYKTTKVLTHE